VRARTLIVWGRGDKVVPLECGEAYARAIPGSRFTVMEKAGHFVDMEQPEALAKLISEFAAGS
jgi:pimeloyl-ACP methyl ester carboxylesterase